jgi:hypothetical protein
VRFEGPVSRAGEPPQTRAGGTRRPDASADCPSRWPAAPTAVSPSRIRVGGDAASLPSVDGAEQQAAALDARVLEIDGVADADAVADRQQVGRTQRGIEPMMTSRPTFAPSARSHQLYSDEPLSR